MPLPNLPTDNLYKFLALAGLTLAIFCFVFPKMQERDLDRAMWETKIDIDVAGEQLRYINEQIGILEVKRDQAYRKNTTLEPIKQDELRILDLQHNLRVQQAQTGNKTKLLGDLTNELAETRFLSKIGVALGLALTILGFFFWYLKLQRYQNAYWKARNREP